MTRSSVLGFALAAVSLGFCAQAQSVISAHSGTIHYTEGQVALDGTQVQPKFGEFPEVKVGQVLTAQDGRAEILLTPGVFLRMGENSSFKMISNQLTNTRLEIQSGEAMIEVGELLPENAITVVFHGADIAIAKRGLYRIDSDPTRLRVYEGEASVVSASMDPMIVHKGHELVFGEAKLEARTFDPKITDEFYRWGARRDEYVAQANISAAKTARDGGYSGTGYSGMGNNGMGVTAGAGSWAFNPWFGMFTYLPGNGMYMSPYGFGYFSPYSVGYMYGPYSPFAYGNGYNGGSSSAIGAGRGTSVASASVPTTSGAVTRAGGLSGGLSSSGSASSGLSAGSGRSGGIGSAGGSSSSGGGISAGHAGGGGSAGAGKH